MVVPLTLFLLIALPFVASLAIAVLGGRGRVWHSGIAALASAIGLAVIVSLAPSILSGRTATASIPWVPALGLDLSLMIDPLGLMFAGMMARPRATSSRTNSGVIFPASFAAQSAEASRRFSRRATNSISGVITQRRA